MLNHMQILEKITYKPGWKFRLLKKGDGFLLQVVFSAPCTVTGAMQEQRGRKWYVSSHACVGEFVRTAFKAIEAAEMHELQENFRYRGEAIFDPHRDPDTLADLSRNKKLGLSVRTPRK
jgi:hypothetical protein